MGCCFCFAKDANDNDIDDIDNIDAIAQEWKTSHQQTYPATDDGYSTFSNADDDEGYAISEDITPQPQDPDKTEAIPISAHAKLTLLERLQQRFLPFQEQKEENPFQPTHSKLRRRAAVKVKRDYMKLSTQNWRSGDEKTKRTATMATAKCTDDVYPVTEIATEMSRIVPATIDEESIARY